MRGTLAQEAREAMNDARAANKAVVEQQPTDAEKVQAYQATTNGVMTEAQAGKAQCEFTYANYALLRYVGGCLVEQGIEVKYNFDKCALVAKWG